VRNVGKSKNLNTSEKKQEVDKNQPEVKGIDINQENPEPNPLELGHKHKYREVFKITA
jgi:hypothetical protein